MTTHAAIEMLVPTSVGEVADKITILQIKSERITDPQKLINIHTELSALETTFAQHFPALTEEVKTLLQNLKSINEALWVIEDDIRDQERDQNFGETFIALARAVYVTNDKRAHVKKAINLALGSKYVEEKSYADYTTQDQQIKTA